MTNRDISKEGPIPMSISVIHPVDSQPVNGNRPDFRKSIGDVCGDLMDILLAKNLDYGNTIAKSPRLLPKMDPQTAAFVRLDDKIARLEQLINRGAAAVPETMDDTLMDLAGYCILLVAYRRSKE